jgi:hypothetical protein
LKEMKIPAIDQLHVRARPPEPLGGVQAPKAPADDDNLMPSRPAGGGAADVCQWSGLSFHECGPKLLPCGIGSLGDVAPGFYHLA